MDRFEYNRPNTRERIAARRRSRATRRGSAATPGLRRALFDWIATGRLAGLVMLLASAGGLLYVFTVPRFTVQDIQVIGAQVMQAQAVIELAAAQGESIWQIDPRQVVERLQLSPYIEHASADVQLPDRLLITIVERRPDVRWLHNGVLYLVDVTGRVLGPDRTAQLTNTLVIEDRSPRPLQPNDRVDPDALKLGRLLSLRLPAELQLTPVMIGWDMGTGVFITTADQRTIIFGQTENIDGKLNILHMLLKEGTEFTYLDLRPATPFYRNERVATPTPAEGQS